MEFPIEPYVGAGPLRLGMSREEARQTVGGRVEEVDRTTSGIPTDFFPELGVFLYYKEVGAVEAIEFGGPAQPVFRDRVFIGEPYRTAEKWLQSLDPGALATQSGIRSEKFGVGLYAPSARKEPDLPVEGVIIFERGYYMQHS